MIYVTGHVDQTDCSTKRGPEHVYTVEVGGSVDLAIKEYERVNGRCSHIDIKVVK
jgi:hypothetical protein